MIKAIRREAKRRLIGALSIILLWLLSVNAVFQVFGGKAQ